MAASKSPQRSFIPEFLRDIRVLQVVGQVLFVIIVIAVFSEMANVASGEMRARGLAPNYAFLENRAGFDISESPDWYNPDSSYGDAFTVGIINTLRIVLVGLVLATVLGILFGIFLLSTNWLIRTISRVYVEILRNTPLLVQLFVWYYIVMFSLPQPREALTLPNEGVFFISIRLVIYIVLYFVMMRSVRHLSSDSPRRIGIITGGFAAAVVIEAAFYLYHTQAGWAGAYGSGDLGSASFLLYAGVSAALIALSFVVTTQLRPMALGATIGQAIGGLLFYFGIAPNSAFRIELYPAIYLSIRGAVFPQISATGRVTEWLAFITLGVIVAGAIWIYAGRITETTGRAIPRTLYAVLAIVVLAVIGWIFVGLEPLPSSVPVEQEGMVTYMPLNDAIEGDLLTPEDRLLYSQAPILVQLPEQNRLGRFTVGTEISPEYLALLLGLVIYTSAFIAEIVRAGIQAVSFGQIEAARAIGLTQSQTLSVVVLPQALRVIIPPLGNQYLNLAKNSSLAIAIAYADTFTTSTTIMNQSGQSVTGITLIMGIYLVMSLTISAVMNWVNSRFQLVTR
ncbi:MAG: ABC transporter permease subunit [Anaerolineae bacterium]|nr:ABC transporter permease subunit [Anaerolineae bacterium]